MWVCADPAPRGCPQPFRRPLPTSWARRTELGHWLPVSLQGRVSSNSGGAPERPLAVGWLQAPHPVGPGLLTGALRLGDTQDRDSRRLGRWVPGW